MITNPPKIITEAEGVEVIDVDGRRLIDGVGGLWNVNLGYSCDPIKKAISDQLGKLPYYSIFRGTCASENRIIRELSQLIRNCLLYRITTVTQIYIPKPSNAVN